MYRMPPAPSLVCSDLVTVLVGLIHPTGGVGILADRASVQTGTDIGHGIGAPADQRVKVRTNGRGQIAGVAGMAENGGVSVLALVEEALMASSDMLAVANLTLGLLSKNAAALLRGVTPTGPGNELALVVLIGGWDGAGSRLSMTGVSWDGSVYSLPLEQSQAFTPASVQVSTVRILEKSAAAGHSLEQQLRDVGDALLGSITGRTARRTISISTRRRRSTSRSPTGPPSSR
jgi:hypothetical protein